MGRLRSREGKAAKSKMIIGVRYTENHNDFNQGIPIPKSTLKLQGKKTSLSKEGLLI